MMEHSKVNWVRNILLGEADLRVYWKPRRYLHTKWGMVV